MKKNEEFDNGIRIKPFALLVFDERGGKPDGGATADYPKRLADALDAHFRVEICEGKCGDIWHTLFREVPEVIIVSQTIREVDAVGLIRSLQASKYKFDIRFFLCCRSVNNSVKSICKLNGIDGAFSFNDDVSATAQRIVDTYSEMLESSGERRLNSILSMLTGGSILSDNRELWEFGAKITEALLVPIGLDPKQRGIKYLELMICMRVFGAEKNMDHLYELTAECYNTTKSAVEKAVRYSIESAWSGSSPYMQYRLFGNSVDPERGKPTNSEFVETLARHTLERILRRPM